MSEKVDRNLIGDQSDQQPPKIEFPCTDYPVKIMGISGAEFQQYVLEVVGIHAPGFDTASMTIKDSSKGTYQSITLMITATGEQQLSDLNSALRASELVKIVL